LLRSKGKSTSTFAVGVPLIILCQRPMRKKKQHQ
jgi:hypothetical protein